MKLKLSHHMPAFPRTPHLPHNPNSTVDDLIASHDEVALLFLKDCEVYEKVDGSNLGICMWEGYPAIRTKNNFLAKGFLGKTAAKNQYRPVFNWFHDHIHFFRSLNQHREKPLVVYGEWMLMSHGIAYDNLPDLFIAFDLWDGKEFLPSPEARDILTEAGFSVPPLLYNAPINSYEQLDNFCQGESEWVIQGDRRREGIYIKQGARRYKKVRDDFVRGKYFTPDKIVKNKVSKTKKGYVCKDDTSQ